MLSFLFLQLRTMSNVLEEIKAFCEKLCTLYCVLFFVLPSYDDD